MRSESLAHGSTLRRPSRWTRLGPRAAIVAFVFAILGSTLASVAPAAAAAVASPGISAAPNVVVGEASGSVSLPVTLSAAGTKTVTVAYATSTGGPCNYPDQPTSGTLTFTPGQTSKVVQVTLNNCGTAGMAWFSLNLSSATNSTIVNPATLVGVVGDPSPVATPGLYVRNAVVDTSAGTVSVPVMLGGPAAATSASTVTVKYATKNGSAVAGTDYTTTSGTLTFAPGQSVQNITVPILGRTGAAPSRSFSMTLSAAQNAVITNGTGVVTIGASGAAPLASPAISAPPNVVAGQADGYVDLPVTLSAPGTQTVTVAYATSTGGPCNYLNQPASGTLTFTPGVTTKVVRVILNNCGTAGIGWFSLNLSGATNATIVNPVTVVGGVGDPAPVATPGLYVRDAVVDTSAGTVSVPVMLGGPAGATSASTVTVKYATANGSAVAGTDYTTTSGTLTFGPGQSVQNITVPILGRSGAAPSRSFAITLSAAQNAVITNGTGVVTIGASGAAPLASPAISAPPNTVVGEADGYLDLPVTLNAPGTKTVTVGYATSTGGPCNYLDEPTSGTLTFTPGVTTRVVRVVLNNCSVTGMTWFSLNLSAATNATIVSPATVVGDVGDPAPVATPGLYVRDAVVDTSAGTVSVPVMLGGPAGATSASTVTVKYATKDGSAVAGTDYTTTSGTLTFGPGQSLQNITVPILGRTGAALSRSFAITLSAAQNAVITDGTGIVTIGASGATPLASPGISAPPNVVAGEASGYLDLPVTLNAPGTKTVTVTYATSTGGPCNYMNESASGTLTFTPGFTTRVVRIILNNCGYAAGGTFSVKLSGATNGHIARASVTVTVVATPKHPGAPSNATATAGNGSATVTFTAPVSDGGDPVNSYTVTASPGGATVKGVTSPITITGLVNGTSYTFTVRATNPEGTGPASPPSNAVTPTG
jgi:Calx-beta domain/Fibronectin type III domain